MPRLLIIGGSDAGISAALRARELDQAVEVSVLLVDRYPNFSICGLPYFLSGDVPDWRSLAHRSTDELGAHGIELLLEHTATQIDAQRHTVAVSSDGGERELPYDKLIVATGAEPFRPSIPGIDQPGVFSLHTIGDSLALQETLAHEPRRAVIVGGGYIGLEMAEALRMRGLEVTVVEQLPNVLPTVDPPLGQLVRDELEANDVAVETHATVKGVETVNGGLRVEGDGVDVAADVVLVVVGVKPSAALGLEAGIDAGPHGTLQVNRRMETNLPDTYAAGDCVATYHRLLDDDTYLPLGTTAHKQGRVAGENAVGGERTFEGSLGTQVVKIFELVAARTGLRADEAEAAGFEQLTVQTHGYDHKVYYPGAEDVAVRITGDRNSGQLLGMQLVGRLGSQVAKRVDIAATALYHGMTVDGLSDLDLSYTPPLGSPWDVVQTGAQAWSRVADAAVAAS